MRRTPLIPLAVVAAAVASGCGGADRPAATPPPPAASASPAPARDAPAKVRINDFEFAPARLTVPAGTKVTWTNEDASNHTVTFAKGPGDLGNVDEKGKVKATFKTPGTYAYVCQYHPTMKGRIVVRRPS